MIKLIHNPQIKREDDLGAEEVNNYEADTCEELEWEKVDNASLRVSLTPAPARIGRHAPKQPGIADSNLRLLPNNSVEQLALLTLNME